MLSTVRTLIVEEFHAMVDDKARIPSVVVDESLEGAGAFAPADAAADLRFQIRDSKSKTRPHRIIATQKPIEEVARFLVGTHNLEADGTPRCTIIDTGHVAQARSRDSEVPNSPLESLMSNEVWEEIYDRLAQMIRQHKTTLVFVNTRRMAERVARHLGERLGDENVTSHHGSLAREIRLAAEQRLKSGELSALVATASLELGIDIGAVDLVVQIGSNARDLDSVATHWPLESHGQRLSERSHLSALAR
jgi:ATP-dependent Lhr-like helicase